MVTAHQVLIRQSQLGIGQGECLVPQQHTLQTRQENEMTADVPILFPQEKLLIIQKCMYI